LRTELPKILATRCDVLSPRMVHMIADLAGDWHRLDERIEGVSTEIEALADQDPACERLMTVPGIGPIISSATVAAIGSPNPKGLPSSLVQLRTAVWTGVTRDTRPIPVTGRKNTMRCSKVSNRGTGFMGYPPGRSFSFDPQLLDDWPPFLGAGLHERAKRLRCLSLARNNLHSEIDEPRSHRRIGQCVPPPPH
jgi:hypothetical protein